MVVQRWVTICDAGPVLSQHFLYVMAVSEQKENRSWDNTYIQYTMYRSIHDILACDRYGVTKGPENYAFVVILAKCWA